MAIKQLSKTIADRLSFGEQVRHAIQVQQREVRDGITRRIPTALPRGVALEPLVGWLGSILGEAADRLREADLAHSSELADDGPARAARDEAAGVLGASLGSARDLIRTGYGDGLAAALGLGGALPIRPDQLAAHGAHVAAQLRAHRAPSTAAVAGVRMDLRAMADDIETKTTALQSALGATRREEREAQTTLSRRDAARDEYVRVYSGVSEIFAGLCTLAGLDDLALKVRPTARRRAGIPDAPAEPEPPVEPVEPGGETS